MSGLENDPPIIPIGVILHVRSGEGPTLFDYFNGPSGGIESTMYLTYDGHWEQYRDTEREADANLHANSFRVGGKRYGFTSIETEGGDNGTWTEVQLAEIKKFILWHHKTHGTPLRVCPGWNNAGIGYHTMWGAPSQWTPVAKSCPGPNRIKQFNSIIKPWLANPVEDDLPSAEEIADAVWKRSLSTTDGKDTHQASTWVVYSNVRIQQLQAENAELKKQVSDLKAQVAAIAPSGALTGKATVTVDLKKA